MKYIKILYIHKIKIKNKNDTIYKIYKYELWKLYKIQNNNLQAFHLFLYFQQKSNNGIFECIWASSNVFWHSGVFCIMNCYFEYRIRIRCIFLYIGTWLTYFLRCFEMFSKTIPEM